MESYLQADFPIGFVIFLQNFAHQITFETYDNEDPYEEYTSDDDDDADDDKLSMMKADFTNNEVMRISYEDQPNPNFERADEAQEWEHRNTALSDLTRVRLDRMILACFSVTCEPGWSLQTNLSLILGADSDLENKISAIFNTESYKVDLKYMKDGVVVIVLGCLQGIEFDIYGRANLTHRLPRHAQCQPSILLRQCFDWRVGNYAPIYFSMDEYEVETYRITPISEDRSKLLSDFWDPTWPELPNSIMDGCHVLYWTPHYMPLSLQKLMPLDLCKLPRESIPVYPDELNVSSTLISIAPSNK
ncbi:hypothetical protein INT43_007517 [Umbelopsis isabellina]|uniref:Uncharacterized protein n=1 Tax=Mortierella isabellina TaxID=91625 RepID=A0A8H7UED1_MORIS|nr:hypothetical protein INT43_007517 [Umbelopsis isabellina]